jgi:hypothetical protein
VAPLPGTTGVAGRTARAALQTLEDGLGHVGGELLSDEGARMGGLRGGRVLFSAEEGVRLDRVVYVPGVEVSARVNFLRLLEEGSVSLRVGGPAAARGALTIGFDNRVRGRLGGRRIDVRLPATFTALAAEGAPRPAASFAQRLQAHLRRVSDA